MAKRFEINDEGHAELQLDDRHRLLVVPTDEGIVLDVWRDVGTDEEEGVWSTYFFTNELLPEPEEPEESPTHARNRVRSEKLLKKMPPLLRNKMKVRDDGRLEINYRNLPPFPSGKDHLPNPIEWDGRQMMWVGIGFTDHGEATGTEPLVIGSDEDDDA